MSETLTAEALALFDKGIKLFLSDPITGRDIRPFSQFDPVPDRDTLIQHCKDNPGANLQVVIGKEEGLMALEVGSGDWAENGAATYKVLCEMFGEPETLAYAMPTGQLILLFGFDRKSFHVERNSGLQAMWHTEGLCVYPSKIHGRPVEKRGAETLLNLSAWIGATDSLVVVPPTPAIVASDVKDEPRVAETTPEPSQLSAVIELRKPILSAGSSGTEQVRPEQNRDSAAAVRCQILQLCSEGKSKSDVLVQALKVNQEAGNVLPLDEVASLVEENTQSDAGDGSRLAPMDLLRQLAEAIFLFSDDQARPYFFYEGEAFAAPSVHVKNRLSYHYLMETGDLPPTRELNTLFNILLSKARFEGPRISLMNRVAEVEEGFVYDLRDKRYVRVTQKGWEICKSFPLFHRYSHSQPQVEPIRDGDPWEVFNYLAVPEENRLLIMVYIISLFVPGIAHPVFAVCGDQGAAKSFFCTVINRLVDPTLTERVIQPKNERDLIQTLRQKYVTVLDNLSKIDNRVSDIFCQVCTGGSISYRQLFTDEGENIAQFRHAVILNSINLAIVNADLMDRSIILKLLRIPDQDRKPEHELWHAFESARARILGGIFDVLARAMATYPGVKVDHLPRLADFAKWGYAIAEALGESGSQFLQDFSRNVKQQNESVAENNVLCQSVLRLMAHGKPYLGKVSDVHAALKSIAKLDAKDETFPKLPHHLRSSLDRLRSSLLEHGIEYQFLERVSDGVKILISKTGSQDTSAVSEGVVTQGPSRFDEAGEADEASEALGEIPTVEFDEMPEVVNE